ncbi:pyruvate kinase [bacterium]|nr:pyruvate kinase [bacterium]
MSIYVENFKKTKIIATVGPASAEKIDKLLAAGVNGIRLNFSHGTHAEHLAHLKNAREAAKKLERSVAIIVDLHGPKIQLGSLPAGGLNVSAGETLRFKMGQKIDEHGTLPIQHDIASEVQKGHLLYMRDGQIRSVVESVKAGVVTVRVTNSGKILSNQGINLPDTHFKSSVLTKKDRKDLEFVYKNDVDYVAMSFVQSADDVRELRDLLRKHGSRAKIIAKIETKVATHHLEEIIAEADAAMVARGDLAVETSAEEVPLVGREIIRLCRLHKKVVIMATQMLEGMMNSLQPSRAEVSDIASAVTLGVDSVMLSGETAIGNYPIETVAMMKKVILATEQYLLSARSEIDVMPKGGSAEEARKANTNFLRRGRKIFNSQINVGRVASGDAQISVSLAAITLAEQLGAKMILAETLSGSTAQSIASLRPTMPILIASPDQMTCNQSALLWGGKPFLIKKREDVAKVVLGKLKKRKNLNVGDMIVSAYGHHRGVLGGTDTIRLIEVE